jgi:hypothetical protein
MTDRSVGDLARVQMTQNTSTTKETFEAAALCQLPDLADNTSLDALPSHESIDISPWSWPMPDDFNRVVQPATEATPSFMPLEANEVASNTNSNSLAVWKDVGDIDLNTVELINPPPSNWESMLPDFVLNADIERDNLDYGWLGISDGAPQGGHNLSSMDIQLWQTVNFQPTLQHPSSGSSGLYDTTQPQWRSTDSEDILAELFPQSTNGSMST